jgi:hypothetical protein
MNPTPKHPFTKGSILTNELIGKITARLLFHALLLFPSSVPDKPSPSKGLDALQRNTQQIKTVEFSDYEQSWDSRGLAQQTNRAILLRHLFKVFCATRLGDSTCDGMYAPQQIARRCYTSINHHHEAKRGLLLSRVGVPASGSNCDGLLIGCSSLWRGQLGLGRIDASVA